MIWFDVLVEGASDVPAIREVMVRKFGLLEAEQFEIHPHQGKGELPLDVLAQPDKNKRQLLHQLPAKLRGFAKSRAPTAVVLVVIDADKFPEDQVLAEMDAMLLKLRNKRPARVLFRLAVEETESWFVADTSAVKLAYPKAKITLLKGIKPDAVVGAWELLAKAIDSTGSSGTDKRRWAELIAPHLNLENPPSPSLKKLIAGIAGELKAGAA
jgi:hypothetical protein